MLIATVKGLLWTQLLPPWYGPDEQAHFAYVQELALTGRVPASATHLTDMPPDMDCSTQALGFRSSGPFYARPPFVPGVDPCPKPPLNQGRLPQRLLTPAGTYNPIYYGLAVPFWLAAEATPVEVRLESVRLLSVLLGSAATLFCYLAALWAFGHDRRLAATTALMFTLQPMLSQQTAVVTNDALVLAISGAFAWLWMRTVIRPTGIAWMAVLGGLVGLALLAKHHGALLALLIPLGLLLQVLASPRARTVVRAAAGLLVAASVAAAIAVAGVGIDLLLHGSPLAATPPLAAAHHGWHDYLHVMEADSYRRLYLLLLQGFWGSFAWSSIAFPAVVYMAIAGVYTLAIVGLVVGLGSNKLRREPIVAAVTATALIVVGIFAMDAVEFKLTGGLVIQGRTFLIALTPLAIVLTGGLASLVPSRLGGAAAAAVCVAVLALQLFSWMLIADAIYA